MEQEGKAWLAWRAKGIGSSDVPVILGLMAEKYKRTPYKLWAEKTGKAEAEDISGAFHVQRGVINEPKARAHFELLHGEDYAPVLKECPVHEWRRVSLDGWNDPKREVLEVKVPGAEVFELAEKGIVVEHYMAQVQYQLMVSKGLKAYFVCFNPDSGRYVEVEVLPSKEWFERIETAINEFWFQNVGKDVPPELMKQDTRNIRPGDSWKEKAARYRNIKGVVSRYSAEIKELEAYFKEETKSEICTVEGCGIRVKRHFRKGNVDYAKIPTFKELDLEQYRKKGAIITSIEVIDA